MRVRQTILASTLFLVCAHTCTARPVVTLRSDLWCPYNCAPGSDHPGYAIEIARTVFDAAGYDVDYQLMNWTRSIDEARQCHADAVIGAIATDVPGFILPAEPIGRSSVGFATRLNSPLHYTDPRSLDGEVIGMVATYEFSGPLGDYLHGLKGDKSRIQYLSGDGALTKNLLKLMAGRVDVVIDDGQVLHRLIDELQLGNQVAFTRIYRGVPVYIAFSPACPASAHQAEILSAGIAQLRASGRLAAILARYGLEDWDKHVRR